jgi:hypothetical protein
LAILEKQGHLLKSSGDLKKHKVYASQKELQFFKGFERGDVKVKRQKLGKKKNLARSWEGPYDFVGYKDPKKVFKSKMKGT